MLSEIELFSSTTILNKLRTPYKIENVTHIVVTSGEISCQVDFHFYSLSAPAMAIFLPGQVIESAEADSHFNGFGIAMSIDFTNSMNLPISLQERLFIKHTQFYKITEEILNVLTLCYKQVSSIMEQESNPYQKEIIRHLFSAHFYGLGYYIHGLKSQPIQMTNQQEVCEKFITLVSQHFKSQREIRFYADKLCITNKYLSMLLKQETGLTALEWIERYVVSYAKSCLTSTPITIQQISNDLDFPSQSVFGKYFKRVVGCSPKAYRQSFLKKEMN